MKYAVPKQAQHANSELIFSIILGAAYVAKKKPADKFTKKPDAKR